jgi:hypothetical protein
VVRLVDIGVTVVWCAIWIGALVVVAYFVDRAKRRRALVITALLFALPPAWWWGSYPYFAYVAERDYAVFNELCTKMAGDKISRRVEGVDSVFQMRARDQSGEVTHKNNQYSMEDPFGAIGDVGSGRSPRIYLEWLSKDGSYEVFERPRSLGIDSRGPFLRFTAVKGASPALQIRQEEVTSVVSRYGYTWEDISTEDMRSRWIAGGRIRIFDLQRKEVLAERTGFYFGRFLNGGLAQHPWSGVGVTCPNRHRTSNFVMTVLIPKK